MKTKAIYGMAAVLLLALAASMAWSQATAGKVQGTITQNKKPLANAQVVLTNKDNGKKYPMKTDKNGQFTGVGIQFGNYEQEISDLSGENCLRERSRLPVKAERCRTSRWMCPRGAAPR